MNNIFGFEPKKTIFSFMDDVKPATPSVQHGGGSGVYTQPTMPSHTINYMQPPQSFIPQQHQSNLSSSQSISTITTTALGNYDMGLDELDDIDVRAEIAPNDLDTVRNSVKRWLELDDQIHTLQTAILDRKKEKNNLNEMIIQFMKNYDTPFFDFDNGQQLVLATSNQKQPLNKNWIQQILQQTLNVEQAKKVEEMLLENRPSVEKNKLKRKKPKGERKKRTKN